MSLWTPDGEHPVNTDAPTPQADPDSPSSIESDEMSEQYPSLDPEMTTEVQEQLANVQAQLLAAPVDRVVSNHVMGLFELASLHLRSEDSDLENARLPIDAMGLLVDNLGDRLAEHDTLAAALAQLRMAYVEVKNSQEAPDDSGTEDGDEDD